jgi:hypothetical protein
MKKERTKTRYGVARRIMRLARSKYAVTALDLVETYQFTYRHALRYIRWMQDENLIYLRYRKDRRNYYSVVRKK